MKWTQVTDIGLTRLINEDSLCVCPEIELFAVADGMGGHQAGEIASRLALQVIEQELKNRLPETSDPSAVLLEAVKGANEALFQAARRKPEWRGMGTTVTACLKRDDELISAHVGDSRAYLIRKETIVQLTEDHTLVHELVKNGGISREQAYFHPQRNVLTRALGTEPVVAVDLRRTRVTPRDLLLLCTDGLTAYLRKEEILALLKSAPGLEASAGTLLREALARGGADNITIVLVEF
ncbi:MAG: Stp1/IreP family PP2C-type Ser/Thr phosphatase [Peptococcaceae bacterium]|nr:MAG: Stp1/IreP family PP2C-type Ser/Thr phosphatase [Peptococcaceae bacterium]